MQVTTYGQALTREGVDWHYVENVPMDSVNEQKSLGNQARDEPINEELVERYAAMDVEGSKAPPLVIWRPGSGKWILADGNHRYQAYKRNKRKTFDAYVIDNTDQKTIDRITWSFNNIVNGLPLNREELLSRAVSWVRKYGSQIDIAAKQWGVKYPTLIQAIRTEEAKEILLSHNVKITSIPYGHYHQLDPLRSLGEDIYVAAARVVVDTGITADAIREMKRVVKKEKTAEARLKAVSEFAETEVVKERKAETKGGRVKVKPGSPREEFLSRLKKLRNYVEEYSADAVRPTGAAYKLYQEMALSVVERLVPMFQLGTFNISAALDAKKEVG